jgi:hypothetical protein
MEKKIILASKKTHELAEEFGERSVVASLRYNPSLS